MPYGRIFLTETKIMQTEEANYICEHAIGKSNAFCIADMNTG